MREHPEDLKWLKDHVRPRLWTKFVAQMNVSKSRGDPDIIRRIEINVSTKGFIRYRSSS